MSTPKSNDPLQPVAKVTERILILAGHPVPIQEIINGTTYIFDGIAKHVLTPRVRARLKQLSRRSVSVKLPNIRIREGANEVRDPTQFIEPHNAIRLLAERGVNAINGDAVSKEIVSLIATRADFQRTVEDFLEANRNPIDFLMFGVSLAKAYRFSADDLNKKESSKIEKILKNIGRIIAADEFSYSAKQSVQNSFSLNGFFNKIEPLRVRLLHDISCLRFRKGGWEDSDIINDADKVDAVDVAYYSLYLRMLSKGASADVDKTRDEVSRYLDIFRVWEQRDHQAVASLYGISKSPELHPHSCIGTVNVALSASYIWEAIDRSGKEKSSLLLVASRHLIIAEQYFRSVRPPLIHGFANLFGRAAILEHLREDSKAALALANAAMILYETSGDQKRKMHVKNLVQMLEVPNEETRIQVIRDILFVD